MKKREIVKIPCKHCAGKGFQMKVVASKFDRYTEKQCEQAFDLYMEGNTLRQIGLMMGIEKPQSVQWCIVRHTGKLNRTGDMQVKHLKK